MRGTSGEGRLDGLLSNEGKILMGLTVPCGLSNAACGLHLHFPRAYSSSCLYCLFITTAAGGNQMTVKPPQCCTRLFNLLAHTHARYEHTNTADRALFLQCCPVYYCCMITSVHRFMCCLARALNISSLYKVMDYTH